MSEEITKAMDEQRALE